jgi:phenylacetate-CoA ligase
MTTEVTLPSTRTQFWNAEAQTMSAHDRRALQAERLRAAVNQSLEAPFFARRIGESGVKADDIRSVEDVAALPMFVKADLRASEVAVPPIGDYRARGLQHAVRIAMSSGTTGVPTAAIWTRHDLDLECELSARNHFRLGIRPGMVIVGAHPGYLNGGQSLQQESYEHMGCLLISIGPPESIEAAERALRTIAHLPIDRWQLFPAALQRLREAAERIGYPGLPESESIGPESQYEKISSGQECVAYLGSTCGLSAGAHLAEDYAIVEALDPQGHPVADGTRGSMVVTSLDRDNPMIRYNVEDIIRIESDACPCGETTRRGFFEGRAKDVVNVGDAAVLPIDVGRVLAASTEYVVVRPRQPRSRLRVRIEGRPDRDIEDRLVESVGVPVDVDWLEGGTLPRAAYKSQRVIDE